MPSLPPPIELLPKGSPVNELPPPAGTGESPTASHRRPLLFAAVFLLSLAVSFAYVWLRKPVYQAAASLLTVAPAAIDRGAAQADPEHVAVQRQTLLGTPVLEETQRRLQGEGGAEHVAIQRDTLLGVPLLEETRRRLSDEGEGAGAAVPTVDDLHGMLSVEPVPETNLVELRARGSEASLLAPVVNAWIDAYQALREQAVRESKDNTSAALEDEFLQLGQKVEAKRRELDEFRLAHDILTKEGSDNQAMARLKGLNEALNKASEEEVLAAAKVDAIRDAIARGEPVVPPEEQQGLENLEKRAQDLREQVKDLRKRYTPQYVALQPQLKLIPEQLVQTEDSIRKMLEDGKHASLSQAEQARNSARQSVQQIRRQIGEHKRDAAEFTARFAEHNALAADLERLETLYRETQARLVQIEAKPTEKYPQLQVVERAYTPKQPLWPDYWRDSGIALGGSLGAALLVLMIHDYLMRRERAPAGFKLPDIQVFSVSESLMLRHRQDAAPALGRQDPAPAALEQDRTPALESPLPRELSEPELRLLLDDADVQTRQVLGLLLSGLTLEEAVALRPDSFDFSANRLRVESGHRSLPLAPRLKAWLLQAEPAPAWADAAPDPDELAALIACAAADAGVPQPETVDAEAVRRSYILHLVRQGMRLADLERVVGRLPARTLAGYARFSPAGPGLKLESVPLVHPVLRGEPASL
jgi:succinoglycan biosynthesis transport protein ExoP